MTDFTDDHQDESGNKDGNESRQTASRGQTPALIEKFVIRLPKGLRNKIKHLSEQNRRSMNSEIIMVLEKHIQQNLEDDAAEILASAHEQSGNRILSETGQPQQSNELTRRLENLPEDKKRALLELLG